ncbi:MAG: hypothetical protein QW179_03500 [Candidatus Hadarchaeales archaeon]
MDGMRGKLGKNHPIEWVALRILEYLVEKSPGSFSLYHLMKLRGMGWQRRDRVRWIMGRMLELGWVEVSGGLYRVTSAGVRAYLEIGRDAQEFIRIFRMRGYAPALLPLEPEAFEIEGDGLDGGGDGS